MDITVAGYRFTGGSSQVKTALKVQKEYRRAQKNNGYPLTFSWLVGYIRTFFRLMIWRMLGNKYAPVIDDFLRVMVCKKPIWKNIYR